jgi:hypothetical protein
MKITTLLIALSVAASCFGADMSFTGYLSDKACGVAGKGKMDGANLTTSPQDHTTACAVACAKSGYGLMVKDAMGYKFVPFNAKGSKLALTFLKKSKDAKVPYVEVMGSEKMNEIEVTSIKTAKAAM